MSRLHPLARVSLTLALVFVILFGPPPAASAHVLIDQSTPRDDGSVEVSLTFDHSCTDSPTVELVVDVPDGAELIEGAGPPGWTATVEGDSMHFAGPGIGDGQAPQFTLVARLAGAVGETLLFPTQQVCADGNGYDWIDPTESEERPAPRLIATEALLDEAQSASEAGGPDALPEDGADVTQLVIALVGLGLVVLLASRVVLRRAR